MSLVVSCAYKLPRHGTGSCAAPKIDVAGCSVQDGQSGILNNEDVPSHETHSVLNKQRLVAAPVAMLLEKGPASSEQALGP